MRKEIKELYIQLLKHGRTIDDLKKDNSQMYELKSYYVDLCGVQVEVKFDMEKPHFCLLTFLYPDQQWQ